MNSAKTLRHWMVLIGCCVLCVFGFALPLLCFGVFISPLVNHFGSSVTEVNLYFTFMTAAAVLSCAVGVRLIEKSLVGTIVASSVVMAAGYILLACLPSIPMVWTAGVLAGFCYPLCSSVVVPIVINRWFALKQATFVGLAFALVGVSGVLAGPLLTSLIGLFGWQMTLAFMGLILLVANVFAAVVLLRSYPQMVGLVPYGAEAEVKTSSTEKGRIAELPGPDYRHMVGSSAFFLIAMAAVLFGFLGDFNTQVNTIVQQSGFSPMVAGIAFSCTSAGLFVGKILLGFVKDKHGAVKSVGLGCAAGIIAFVGIVGAIVKATEYVLYASCALCGICTCLGTVAPALLAGETFGQRAYAQAVSHTTAFINVGMALGAPLYSLSFDMTGSFVPVLILCAVVPLLAFMASVLCVRRGKALQVRAFCHNAD